LPLGKKLDLFIFADSSHAVNLKDYPHSHNIARLPYLVKRLARYNRHLFTTQCAGNNTWGISISLLPRPLAYNSLAFQDGAAELKLGNLSP